RPLGKLGAKLAFTGHTADNASACDAALMKDGVDSFATPFQVTSVPDTQRMADEVAAHFGRIDILVNCVGLNREEKAEEVTEEKFDYVLDVNLKGAMFQAQAAARHMIKQ